ncbi:BnaA01g34500D [Brassica napus]|uniref:RING-type E3 ubiquitin transferase n=1 Tax=Brassica napus TaxID=3708 RepID=A0A078JDT9_BRANA|nr:BnaA01g34500D [Brassica napus]
MHSAMCLELKKLVDRVMRIFPDIEDARPGSSTGIQTLCLINKALEKAKLLLQYCSESSKLYMAVTGEAILSRGCRAKKLLEQSLSDIRSMVPTVLATKITQVVQDLRSTVLALESSEEEAGKAVRELMQRSTTSSVSSDEVRDFHYAALKLHLSTPEAIVIERKSLKSLFAKLGEDHKENSFTHLNDSVCASAAEAGCSEEEQNGTLPEHFKCPLSLTVMHDPVIISSGHTFERMWVQKWFDEGNESCPKTRRTLDDFTMKPNVAMKEQISKWCSRNGLHVQDPTTKQTKSSHNLDFSIASFGSSLYNLDFSSRDFSSSFSTDSPSKGGYFMPMQTIASESGTEVTDSSQSEVEIEPLSELTKLPWEAQVKTIQDVRKRFEDNNSRAFQSMSPSKFLEPLVTFLKNAAGTNGDTIKSGLALLLTFLSGNRRAIEALEEDVFETLSVFLGFELLVAEEALNVLEVLSNQPHSLSKITLSSLMKMVESGPEHLQEQAMITLKNLSSSNEICPEMVTLGFVKNLTLFLQQSLFSKQSIIIMRNLCNTEKGRVCITETPGCLASIAELLDSNVPEEQENAISILLQLCVEKIEYCNLVVREGVDIYPSLFLISNNGTEEAKVGASELLRALEEVDFNREEEEEEEEVAGETATNTSQVVAPDMHHDQPIITTPSPKKSGLFGLSFSILKKKKR